MGRGNRYVEQNTTKINPLMNRPRPPGLLLTEPPETARVFNALYKFYRVYNANIAHSIFMMSTVQSCIDKCILLLKISP